MDLPTQAEIPWTDAASLGAGVAAPSADLLKSAVEPVTVVPKKTRKESFVSKDVHSEREIRELVSVDASAGFNTAAVAASAKTHVEDNLSVSNRSSTVVATGRYEWDPALASSWPRLTDEARSVYDKNPSEFHRRYGHYFIAGFKKEATLSIFAQVTGESRESVLKVSADVNAEFKNAGWKAKAEAATAIENSAREQRCEIAVRILKTGMSEEQDPAVGLSLSDVPAQITDFQKRAVGSEATALLVHYARVEPEIDTRTDVSDDMYEKANRFYEDLTVARVLSGDLPRHYVLDMAKELDDIAHDAEKYVPRDLSGDYQKLSELADRIEGWLIEARRLTEYRRLWHDAYAAPGSSGGWGWGVTSLDTRELCSECELKSGDCRESYEIGREGKVDGYLTIDVPKRRIFGIELTGNKPHNGDHALRDGGLGKDFVKFYFQSEYDRGFNWTAKVWSVPTDRARFELDEL